MGQPQLEHQADDRARSSQGVVGVVNTGCVIVAAVSVLAQTPSTISIRASRVLDGRGEAREHAVIEIAGSKITKIEQRSGPVTYDLGTAAPPKSNMGDALTARPLKPWPTLTCSTIRR
jgi:hypothetical protein